jgi:acylphosphatase
MVGSSDGSSTGTRVKDRKGRRFLISGRVQGVGYRAYAVESAGKAGVAGWTRNLEDGRVEVEASGTKQQLDEFEELLRKGPRFSDVQEVAVVEAVVAEGREFVIRS